MVKGPAENNMVNWLFSNGRNSASAMTKLKSLVLLPGKESIPTILSLAIDERYPGLV